MDRKYLEPILNISKKLGLDDNEILSFGRYKAKISKDGVKRISKNKKGKLILVTAINPTPAGEGKTTVSIGLAQGMKSIGEKAIVALREPSLGPVFGMKGGATGGGVSSVGPMDEINLHFTGDMHAITSANNLLSALIDNHLHHGNALNIDPRRIEFSRVLDINDRSLRKVVIGLGGFSGGVAREDNFTITVASEIMAIFCLSEDIHDLSRRISNILIGYNYDKKPVFVEDLGVTGALVALLKEAFNPNLVQTYENTPAIIHGGPFANIAHGCNSVVATKTALGLADYTITEAGFGSDLGAEKFFDIKCRQACLTPSAVVLVATVKALKYNGGARLSSIEKENLTALGSGLENLFIHIENMNKFGIPVVVAINKFSTDTKKEIELIKKSCEKIKVIAKVTTAFADGGEGAKELAMAVLKACNKTSNFSPIYPLELSYKKKIKIIAKEIYRAKGVDFSSKAKNKLRSYERAGFSNLPVCIAKTQYSLSDNPKLLNNPKDFNINVTDVKISSGAGFLVAYCGDIMTMPGLPKLPAANNISVKNNEITGLF